MKTRLVSTFLLGILACLIAGTSGIRDVAADGKKDPPPTSIVFDFETTVDPGLCMIYDPGAAFNSYILKAKVVWANAPANARVTVLVMNENTGLYVSCAMADGTVIYNVENRVNGTDSFYFTIAKNSAWGQSIGGGQYAGALTYTKIVNFPAGTLLSDMEDYIQFLN